MFTLLARRGRESTPRQTRLTNGAASPGAAVGSSQADSPLFSSPGRRQGTIHSVF